MMPAGLTHVSLLILGAGALVWAESSFEAARRWQAHGQYAEAELAYRAFLKEQPQSVQARTNLGVVLAHEGRFAEAIAEYRKALSIDEAAGPAKVNLALAYYRLSDWRNAAMVFQEVLQASPKDRRALQLIAICFFQDRRYQEAVNAYRQLMPSDDPSILIGLSSALREVGQRAESEELLSGVIQKHPDSPRFTIFSD